METQETMKRPIKEEYFDYMSSPDGDFKVPDEEGYFNALEQYADHSEQEIEKMKKERTDALNQALDEYTVSYQAAIKQIERLKAERVELVNRVINSCITAVVNNISLEHLSAEKMVEQFNKEKS